jgi:hypothetical protein
MTVQVRGNFALLNQTPIGLGKAKLEWQMQDIQATCCVEAPDICLVGTLTDRDKNALSVTPRHYLFQMQGINANCAGLASATPSPSPTSQFLSLSHNCPSANASRHFS